MATTWPLNPGYACNPSREQGFLAVAVVAGGKFIVMLSSVNVSETCRRETAENSEGFASVMVTHFRNQKQKRFETSSWWQVAGGTRREA